MCSPVMLAGYIRASMVNGFLAGLLFDRQLRFTMD